jgi:hypothetical protein
MGQDGILRVDLKSVTPFDLTLLSESHAQQRL